MILSLCPNPSIDTYAWLDSFKAGGVNRIKRIQEYPGGKGVHVALAVAELGHKSRLIGAWAGGAGDWIKSQCKKKNVAPGGIDLEGNSRKCYTFRTNNVSFNNSELLEPGPEFNTQKWGFFIKIFQEEIESAKLVCMSGSWPINAPIDSYAQLIEIGKNKKIPTIIDCTGNQLQEALKKGFFGLHLNQSEAENLCGSQDIFPLLKKLNGKVELIALTKGKEGLILVYKNRILTANVKIDRVISTVGSGDCLTAGIAHAVSKDLSLEEIAAYGVACGAANCLNEDLGQLLKEDVHKLLPKVEVKEITNEA